MSVENSIVLIKGGGEMASGVAHRLSKCHFRVCITEIPKPQAVRRGVSFCEAVYEGEKTVEGITAKRINSYEEVEEVWNSDRIPLIVDPAAALKGILKPTVLVDVNHEMDLMREESFGPVIGIQKVSDDGQALELMNDSLYGLTAGVYSKDRSRAEVIMSKLQAGTVYWNCCDRVSPALPWSGRGYSGIGSTLGTVGIDTFIKPKAWHFRYL